MFELPFVSRGPTKMRQLPFLFVESLPRFVPFPREGRRGGPILVHVARLLLGRVREPPIHRPDARQLRRQRRRREGLRLAHDHLWGRRLLRRLCKVRRPRRQRDPCLRWRPCDGNRGRWDRLQRLRINQRTRRSRHWHRRRHRNSALRLDNNPDIAPSPARLFTARRQRRWRGWGRGRWRGR